MSKLLKRYLSLGRDIYTAIKVERIADDGSILWVETCYGQAMVIADKSKVKPRKGAIGKAISKRAYTEGLHGGELLIFRPGLISLPLDTPELATVFARQFLRRKRSAKKLKFRLSSCTAAEIEEVRNEVFEMRFPAPLEV